MMTAQSGSPLESISTIVQAHNKKAQSVWNSPAGRYDEISRSIADAIEHAVERLRPRYNERVLDLATGTGWASRIIAQRFGGQQLAKLIGTDIAEEMLDYARAAAALQKLRIEYTHADAERMPFADAEFDAIISTFGVMFVGNPEAAASELARVVKRGGRVVLSTWKPTSNVFNMFSVMKKFMPPPPAGSGSAPPPSPFEWGKRERIEQLLGAHFDLAFEDGTNRFRYESGESAWQLWSNHYGPTLSLAKSLDDQKRAELHRALVEWHEQDNFETTLGYEQPRDYLIVRAIRK